MQTGDADGQDDPAPPVDATARRQPAAAWSGIAPFGDGGRPGLLVLVQIVTDVDLLAPVVEATRRDGRFAVRVVVSARALRKTPELAALLARAFGGANSFEVADEEALLAGRAPDLAGIQAILAATESTAPAHRVAHRLAERGNAAGLHTATMQHGFDNLGLTWFDAQYAPATVRFASRTIFTWGPPERLHAQILPETRARCVPVGCPKPARSAVEPPPRLGARDRLVAVFENLHWNRYSPSYRERFLADLEAAAAAHRDTTFVVKPHPAGKWLTRRFDGPRPAGDNLVILEPGEAKWERYDAAGVLALADAVVTTPSTIALDAARRQLPVAVAAYGLDVSAYAPLRALDGAASWSAFLDACRAPALDGEERGRAGRFVAAALLAGDAATAIVAHLHALVASGPAPRSAPRVAFTVAPPAAPAGFRRLFARLRGGTAPVPAPAYVADPGGFTLSAGAERAIADALRQEVRAGRQWPKAVAWDDAVTALHWRKQRLRLFGVRRAARDAELLAQTDLRLAGAVREDVVAGDPTATLRQLLGDEPGSVLFVDGAWRFLGLSAERRGFLDAAVAAPPRAASIAVIVNYRDLAAATIGCLESVAAQRTSAALELVLVDNQSRPSEQAQVVAAAQRLAARRPGLAVRQLAHDEPFNHSRQNNRAAALAAGEVLVFLNNDARLLSPDLLQRIADEALRPGVATAGPRIVGRGGQLVCAGMTLSFLPAPGSKHQQARLRELEGPHGADRRRGTLGTSFCCAAVSRATWTASGGLDEAAFPTQYNDADFCLRLTARGLRHVYLGDVVAFHQPGGSEPRDPRRIERLHQALLERHGVERFDRFAPDHYELPRDAAFAGDEGQRWTFLLRAQARLAAAQQRSPRALGAAAVKLADLALAKLQGQLAAWRPAAKAPPPADAVLPVRVLTPDDELAAQWHGIGLIVQACLEHAGADGGEAARAALVGLLQRARAVHGAPPIEGGVGR